MRDDPREPSLELLIDRVLHGDRDALAAVFANHRDRLWRIVSFRIDPRLGAARSTSMRKHPATTG